MNKKGVRGGWNKQTGCGKTVENKINGRWGSGMTKDKLGKNQNLNNHVVPSIPDKTVYSLNFSSKLS